MAFTKTVVRVVSARAGAARDGGRPIGRKLAAVLLALAVFALPTALTLSLKHADEGGFEAEGHLQAVGRELQIQDGLEWRVISGRVLPRDVRDELVASRLRGQTNLTEVERDSLSPGSMGRLSALTQRYSEMVDEELRLLSLGQQEAALELDETQVDPAFEQASTLLDNQMQQTSAWARQAQRLSDVGVVLILVLSLVAVGVIQGKRRRALVRHQTERKGEARYRTLIDQAADLVLVVDRGGRVTFASPSVERLLAPLDQDLPRAANLPAQAGRIDFVAALDPLDRAGFSAFLAAAVPGSMSTGEFRLNARHGTATCEVSVQDLTDDPSVQGLVLTAHDVTEHRILQNEMERRALHDSLTGLPNRALLADRFEQALLGAQRAGTSVGLLVLDLDRFKEVNDTFGHHYGDELLRQIGPRLAGILRGVDTIARLGGDEFAVLLPDVHGVGDATAVAEALLAALAIPFTIEGVDMDVEASIGVAMSGLHGDDDITLMQRADIAMYVAKTQHLGVSVYDPGVDRHSATKLAMVGDLRRALDGDELVLYYQPKVSITTGEVLGAEALVRWQHPEHGLVFPDEFIPLAESTGLMNPLTRRILDIALAQARVWIDCGRPLQIAVNLSARNLHDERFADLVAQLLVEHDVPAHLLELEVTETAIMSDPERARVILEQLSLLGIRLSLDDFGAGYTSLSQLTTLPISEIKIDRSFVMTMADDPSNALIVSSVVDLGHNLGMTIVAEGVETAHALTALSTLGCDIAQGYHISRPIPVALFDTWVNERLVTTVLPDYV